jgi:hypothetical protein
MKSVIQNLNSAFYARPKRERTIVMVAFVAVLGWGLLELVQGSIGSFGGHEAKISSRIKEIEKLQFQTAKYKKLSARLADLDKTYANSELSVEQVYSEVENVVKAALADGGTTGTNDGYELRSAGTVVSISDSIQQQGYTLKLKALSLKQLVDLLYRLEQGKAPLFLGRLEIAKGSQPGIFSANLELSSIRRKKA